MTDSLQTLLFPALSVAGKDVTARFDGGDITSDAGVLLLAQADKKMGLVNAMTNEMIDERQNAKVQHSIPTLLRQRIFAIACGYEDANDFDYLHTDPALKLACGRAPQSGLDLASQPTLSRLENRVNSKDIYCMAHAIARCVVSQLPKKTKRVVIDIDAYEDPCHGQQELEFFNAHYDSHCYLPLAIFITPEDGAQRLLGAVLRPGTAGNAGVRALIRLAVGIVRERFPKITIILRADSGFGNAQVLHLCDQLKISYCLGLRSNSRLQVLSTRTQMQACWRYTFAKEEWKAVAPDGCLRPDADEGDCRVFGRLNYKAGSWQRKHNVVVKAQIKQGALHAHYIVTDLYKRSAQKAHAFYCGRGDAENRIKEFKLDLYAGRTSCHRFLANQFRLLLHVAAMALINLIQQAAKETPFAHAQAGTIRLRLLKLGARVVETTRRIWLHLSSSYPGQDAWHQIHRALSP